MALSTALVQSCHLISDTAVLLADVYEPDFMDAASVGCMFCTLLRKAKKADLIV